MRIYFVLEHLSGRGGVETVLTTTLNKLSELGHDVHVFLPDPSDNGAWEEKLPSVYYYHNPIIPPDSGLEVATSKAMELGKLFNTLKDPDFVVATHVPHTTLYSRLALGYNDRIPLVSWLHNPPERFNDSHLVNYADLHWAISSGIKDKIQKIGPRASSVFFIGNPIELNVEKKLVSTDQNYVFIGRLENQQKRLDILFQALKTLDFKWTLDIYGTGPDEDKIRKFAIDLGIHEYIRFNGWFDNPWADINNITALILASDFEGMPMVVGEALARGVPVISTDCETGPSDLVKNDCNGWLVPTGDAEKLSDVIKEVSNYSIGKLESTSKNAIESVQKYSIDNVIKKMLTSISYYIPEER